MRSLRVGKIPAVLTFSVMLGWLVLWLGVGAPLTTNIILGQLVSPEQEWKTYFNPEYEFTIQYPDYPYLNFDVWNNSTEITLYSNNLIDYTVNMGLSIQPLNASEHPDLLTFVEYTYNRIIPNNADYKILQNITLTEYSSYPAYTITYSSKDVNPNDYTIHRAVYQLHDDLIYIFWMANSNKDYHGEVFDKMIDSIKFF